MIGDKEPVQEKVNIISDCQEAIKKIDSTALVFQTTGASITMPTTTYQ